jgi:hypothetical protein
MIFAVFDSNPDVRRKTNGRSRRKLKNRVLKQAGAALLIGKNRKTSRAVYLSMMRSARLYLFDLCETRQRFACLISELIITSRILHQKGKIKKAVSKRNSLLYQILSS